MKPFWIARAAGMFHGDDIVAAPRRFPEENPAKSTGICLAVDRPRELRKMKPFSSTRSLVPVLYVGHDFTADDRYTMLARRIGVMIAENADRAERLLSQFRVAAVVFATPDLQGMQRLAGRGTPLIVLAGRSATCEMDGVTVLRRDTGLEDLAAVIYGVVGANLSQSRRDAA